MRRKLEKDFEFSFPLTKKVVKNLRLQTIHIGDLLIQGKGYFFPDVSIMDLDNDRYSVDIDFIKWNGTDIRPVLETGAEDLLKEVFEAAVQHVSGLDFITSKYEVA